MPIVECRCGHFRGRIVLHDSPDRHAARLFLICLGVVHDHHADLSGDDSDSLAESGADFSTEEDAESLSEQEQDAIEALLDIPAFTGTEVEVVSWAEGAVVGTRALDPSVFGVPVRRDVVHDVVRWQLARRRSANAQV